MQKKKRRGVVTHALINLQRRVPHEKDVDLNKDAHTFIPGESTLKFTPKRSLDM